MAEVVRKLATAGAVMNTAVADKRVDLAARKEATTAVVDKRVNMVVKREGLEEAAMNTGAGARRADMDDRKADTRGEAGMSMVAEDARSKGLDISLIISVPRVRTQKVSGTDRDMARAAVLHMGQSRRLH